MLRYSLPSLGWSLSSQNPWTSNKEHWQQNQVVCLDHYVLFSKLSIQFKYIYIYKKIKNKTFVEKDFNLQYCNLGFLNLQSYQCCFLSKYIFSFVYFGDIVKGRLLTFGLNWLASSLPILVLSWDSKSCRRCRFWV